MDFFNLEGIVAAITAVIFIVAWFARLEFLTKSNEKNIEKLERDVTAVKVKIETVDSKIMDQLTEMKVSLAKIEGKLGIEK